MFEIHDIAAYQGPQIKVKTKKKEGGTATIRGLLNVNTTDERSETRVPEMGMTVQKAIYGTSTYSASITLTLRDLVQLSRLAGLNPSSEKYFNVEKLKFIDLLQHMEDPDNPGTILLTKIAHGFKGRTNSGTGATDANSQVTVDGACDLCNTFDGPAYVYKKTIADKDTGSASDTAGDQTAIGGTWDSESGLQPKYLQADRTLAADRILAGNLVINAGSLLKSTSELIAGTPGANYADGSHVESAADRASAAFVGAAFGGPDGKYLTVDFPLAADVTLSGSVSTIATSTIKQYSILKGTGTDTGNILVTDDDGVQVVAHATLYADQILMVENPASVIRDPAEFSAVNVGGKLAINFTDDPEAGTILRVVWKQAIDL